LGSHSKRCSVSLHVSFGIQSSHFGTPRDLACIALGLSRGKTNGSHCILICNAGHNVLKLRSEGTCHGKFHHSALRTATCSLSPEIHCRSPCLGVKKYFYKIFAKAKLGSHSKRCSKIVNFSTPDYLYMSMGVMVIVGVKSLYALVTYTRCSFSSTGQNTFSPYPWTILNIFTYKRYKYIEHSYFNFWLFLDKSWQS
jgi:hypothetical protein